MFDNLKEDSAHKLGRLEQVGASNQDTFHKIQENQGNLHQRVSGLERAFKNNQVDVCYMESVEGSLDRLWDDSLNDLRFFCQVIERVEQVQDDWDQRLQMALDCLDAAKKQRREESTMLQMKLDNLASRN